MARRLCERGVRFVQLFHRGWDQHLELPKNIALQCGMTDRPTAALVRDLKQRGLLDDTSWSGVENSDEQFTVRGNSRLMIMAAIIILDASQSGLPVPASNAVNHRRDR